MTKCLKWMTIINAILVQIILLDGGFSMRTSRIRSNHRSSLSASCPMPKIKNGNVRMQRGGRMANFYCTIGFELHGAMSILCQMGRWKQDLPICIKSGCSEKPKRDNGFVMIDEKNQTTMLFCEYGYLSASSTIAYCDGKQWDRELGECRPDVNDRKSCDFESSNLCEWTQDGDNDFPWVRRHGWNSFEKLEFGPKHDHTIGKPLQGFYMVAEATNSRSTQKSRLWSPVYTKNDSKDACFRFYYHMYGQKIGQLQVFIKPFDMTIKDVRDQSRYILFDKKNSQGNQWNEFIAKIEPIESDFQIIFEATGSNGLISDIAIDDVALLNDGDCIKSLPTTETVTEEKGGIFDVLSCVNRCTETQSIRINGSILIAEDGAITEKCDCHTECLDLGTCCIDYQSKCFDSQSTESILFTTPLDDAIMDKSMSNSLNMKQITQAVEKIRNTTQIMKKTTLIPTSITTSTSTTTSTTTSTSTSTTTSTPPPSKSSTLKPIPIFTPPSNPFLFPKIIPKLNSTPATTNTSSTSISITKSINKFKLMTPTKSIPTSTPNPTQIMTSTPTSPKISIVVKTNMITLTKSPSIQNSTNKMSMSTIKIKNQIITTPTVKPFPTSIRLPKLIRNTIPTTITTTMRTTVNITTLTSSKSNRHTISSIVSPSVSKNGASQPSDSTTNAMRMPSDTGKFISLSTIIAVGILLTLTLIGWKYFNANKWNQFNSQQIEFKSNYRTEGANESLIRSDSFIIDDLFNENAIDDCNIADVRTCNEQKILLKDNEKIQTTVMSKTIKRNQHRLVKNCDQYSEKRCLTADDEQLDFTPQTSL